MTELLFDSSNDAILIMNLDGSICKINRAAKKLITQKGAAPEPQHILEVLPKISPNQLDEVIRALLFNEIPEQYLYSLDTSNGIVPISVQFSALKDPEKGIAGFSASMRKITATEQVANKAQALLETAPDAMVVINGHGQIVLINAQTEKLFGYLKNELMGKKVEILVPNQFLKNHKNHRDSYIKDPKPRSLGLGHELLGKRKNGSTFPVEISLSPLKTDDDSLFVSAAIRDISYRKRAENKFKGLLESAPDAMVIVNKDGIIQLVNNQVKNIFGYEKAELEGKKVETLIPNKYRNNHANHRHSFFKAPKTRPMGAGLELLGLRKNGEEFPVEISISPLEMDDNILVSAAIRDITERKAAETSLKEFNRQLQSKNKELEQFAYIASHDLQEPLRTITGFANIISEQYSHSFDQIGHRSMKYIIDASNRMSQLIKGLLDYSRLGRNREIKMVDCTKLLREIQNDLVLLLKSTNGTLKYGNLPSVKGNEVELRLLLQNLISNGIKFRRPKEKPHIEVSAEYDKQGWIFAVKDNGIGIPKQYQKRVFLLFQRLHERGEYEGTGIGLAHCQKIVDAHGGQIWLKSDNDQGSTFFFQLPHK